MRRNVKHVYNDVRQVRVSMARSGSVKSVTNGNHAPVRTIIRVDGAMRDVIVISSINRNYNSGIVLQN